MKIRVNGMFTAPEGSLLRLSHEGVKSQYERRRPWLVKHGGWMRCTRPLQFKDGEELEIKGPIKDRLLAETFEVLEADEAEVVKPKPNPVFTPPKKKTTKKKVSKKKVSKKA